MVEVDVGGKCKRNNGKLIVLSESRKRTSPKKKNVADSEIQWLEQYFEFITYRPGQNIKLKDNIRKIELKYFVLTLQTNIIFTKSFDKNSHSKLVISSTRDCVFLLMC